MRKFIDADELLVEIERLIEEINLEYKKSRKPQFFLLGKINGLEQTLNLVRSLQQEQPEVDLEKLVNEEFASRSRTTEHGLEVAYNRAELSRFIKRIAMLFTTGKEVEL